MSASASCTAWLFSVRGAVSAALAGAMLRTSRAVSERAVARRLLNVFGRGVGRRVLTMSIPRGKNASVCEEYFTGVGHKSDEH